MIIDNIPVKVPIPNRIKVLDKAQRKVAMREWWRGYALRYEDYRADRADEHYVYMTKKG